MFKDNEPKDLVLVSWENAYGGKTIMEPGA